jgi:hypothetical protein
MHYAGTRHSAMDELCSQRGVTKGASAPPCYTPNVLVFKRHDSITFRALSVFLSVFKPSEKRILMGLLKTASKLEKYNLHFMQKVYFRAGDNYLCNYMQGHALGVGDGVILVIGNKVLDGASKPVAGQLDPKSVISAERFASVRKKLIAEGRINDPAQRKRRIAVTKVEDYEPPTIDTRQEDLEASVPKSKKRNMKFRIEADDIGREV